MTISPPRERNHPINNQRSSPITLSPETTALAQPVPIGPMSHVSAIRRDLSPATRVVGCRTVMLFSLLHAIDAKDGTNSGVTATKASKPRKVPLANATYWPIGFRNCAK